MIIDRLLIINCTGITFLKRLIDWKNTPNLTIRICLLLMRKFISPLLRLFPLILNTLWLYFVQYTVRWLPNNVWGLLKSLLWERFLFDLRLLNGDWRLFLFRWFSCFNALRSFRHSFFILPFFTDKTRQVGFCNIKLNIHTGHTREYAMLSIRRCLLCSFLRFTTFHEENYLK